MSGTIWGELGIAATRDVQAIRRAYAARLKTIDPEVDPQAFVALREAYERATSIATQPEDDWADADETDWRDDEDASEDADASAGFDESAAQGWRLFDDIAEILTDRERQDVELDPKEDERIRDLLAQWLGWLKAAPIALSHHYELQMASLLASTIPRSDALIEDICTAFAWDSRAGRWDTLPQIELLLERRARNRARTGAPTTAVAPAMDDYTRWHLEHAPLLPGGGRVGDDGILSAPSGYPARGKWHGGGARLTFAPAAILVLLVIGRMISIGPEPLDLQKAVGRELPLAELRTVRPELVAKLEEELRIAARDRATQKELTYQAQEWLNDAVSEAMPSADAVLLRDFWRLFVARLEHYRTQRPSVCADFLLGRSMGSDGRGPVDPTPAVLDRQITNLRARVLLAPKPAPARRQGNETLIPREIVEQVAIRTGLPEARVLDALRSQGSDADICEVRLMFSRMLVDDPSDAAVQLMRDL